MARGGAEAETEVRLAAAAEVPVSKRRAETTGLIQTLTLMLALLKPANLTIHDIIFPTYSTFICILRACSVSDHLHTVVAIKTVLIFFF